MREGWVYKSLKEICVSIKDGSHNPPKGGERSNYLMISSQNIFNDELKIDDVRYLSKEDFEKEDKRTNLKAGDILLTIVGTIGRCYVFNGNEGNVTLQRSVGVLSPKEEIDSRYLMYVLRSKNEELNREAHGIAQKGIYLNQLALLSIPIASLSKQKEIVAELDSLNQIIDLKRQQLKEYEALAESIFYEMFGDPFQNDRVWEQKKWEDVLTIINGKNQRAVENPNGRYPICGSGGIMGYSDQYICPENCVIIGRKGNINRPIFMKEKFWNVDTAFGLSANEGIISPLYLFFFCKFYNFEQLNKAVTIPSLTKTDLLNVVMSVPPFSLQQSFSSQIEAIEHQKELVRESIKECEVLFQSRMDYWFNEK